MLAYLVKLVNQDGLSCSFAGKRDSSPQNIAIYEKS